MARNAQSLRELGFGATRPGSLMPLTDGSKRDVVERFTIGNKRSWLQRTITGIKSIAFTRNISWTWMSDRGVRSGGGEIDYRKQVGDGRNNAIVLAALDMTGTTFAQSPLQVKTIVGDQQNIVSNHEMVQLINKPNPYYSGKLLWKATMYDYMFGNAYWLKVKSEAGKPVQYYWIPSYLIRPDWPQNDPKVFISRYVYTPNGKEEYLNPKDVVHFRNGMDPNNIRLGLSPLGAMLREIATDDEAAEFTNTILRNLGVAGIVVSPSTDKVKISPEQAEKLKASITDRTTGDKRGQAVVLSASVKVDQMATDISKLDLAAIRNVPEERLTAIFGTPAVLLGLGTGLENATFSNVDGLRRIYMENKMIPTQSFIGEDVKNQILIDFESDVSKYVVDFDNTGVRVLQEDEDKRVDRWLKEMESGGMTANEFRALRNREPYPEDVFMLSSRIIPISVKRMIEDASRTAEEDAALAAASKPAGTSGSGGNAGGATGNGGGNDNSSGANGSKLDRSDIQTKTVNDSIGRTRARMQASCTTDVHAYLLGQLSYVEQQVLADGQKARINWPRVQEDVERLKSVLEPWYKRALVAVHDVVQDALSERYELSGTEERTYLKSAALNIKGINETTRRAVADAISKSVELDETTDELTARLRALDVFSSSRAVLIAKVELAQAANLAQLTSYISSEVVVGVQISDGDQDEVCLELNGRKVPIKEARSIPPLGHPNCTRAFHHIMNVADLESEAA